MGITGFPSSSDSGLPLSGGTMSGDIDMNGNKVTNLPSPSDNSDAATKEYVDSNSGGTVSSVGISAPGILSVSGSPVTTSGTLALTLANQASGKVWAGPTSGPDAQPTFRSVTLTDLPSTVATQTFVNTVVNSLNLGSISGQVNLGTQTTGQLDLSAQTVSGAVDMNNNALINLQNPTNPGDAVNLFWLDTYGDSSKLPLAGGTMAGGIDMGGNTISEVGNITGHADGLLIQEITSLTGKNSGSGQEIDLQTTKLKGVVNPTDAQDASTKDYVDTAITNLDLSTIPGQVDLSTQTTGQLDLANQTVSASFGMGGFNLQNLGDPSGDGDAVPKLWAESKFLATDVSSSMNGNNITDVADPINPQDAATWAWVDNRIFGGSTTLSSGEVEVVDSRVTVNTVVTASQRGSSATTEQLAVQVGSGGFFIRSTDSGSSTEVYWTAINN